MAEDTDATEKQLAITANIIEQFADISDYGKRRILDTIKVWFGLE